MITGDDNSLALSERSLKIGGQDPPVRASSLQMPTADRGGLMILNA